MRGATVLVVLMLGLLVTSISGFYGRDYGTSGRTDTRYGIPFNWHGEQGSASSNGQTGWFSWQNFVYDTAAWSILFGILALIFTSGRRGKAPNKTERVHTTDIQDTNITTKNHVSLKLRYPSPRQAHPTKNGREFKPEIQKQTK